MTAEAFTAAMTDAVRVPGPVSPASARTVEGIVIGGCQCGAGIALTYGGESVTVLCPGCGTPVRLARVHGTMSQDLCDSQCMGAVGKYCACACGGRNHGKGWQTRIVPTWEPIPGVTVPPVEYIDRSAAATAARRNATAARQSKGAANRARAAERRAERETAAEARRDATRAAMLALPEVAVIMGDRYAGSTSGFVLSMRTRVRDGEELSPGMLAAIARMVDQDAERDARRAAETARAAAAEASGARVRPGRQLIRGVITRYVRETDRHGYRDRRIHVITVQVADGCRYRGTLPSALEPEWTREIADAFKGWPERIVGQRVTLIAGDVVPSERDPLFGFFKRPTVPAGTPRLSHIGPDAQVPDGPAPEVTPARPRRAREAAPPPLSAEAAAAADGAVRRLAALDLAVSVIQRGENAAAAGWTTNGCADRGGFPETWGPGGSVHMGAIGGNGEDDPVRFEVRLYRPDGSHAHTVTVSQLDDALTVGRAMVAVPAGWKPAEPPAAPPAPAAGGWGAILAAHVTRTVPHSGPQRESERYVTKSNGSCGRWVRGDDSVALCTCGWKKYRTTRAEAQAAARWHRAHPHADAAANGDQAGDVVQDQASGWFYRCNGDGSYDSLSDVGGHRPATAVKVGADAIARPVRLVRDGAATGDGDPLAVRMALVMARRYARAAVAA